MATTPDRPQPGAAFDPASTPIPRRRVLLLMGVGAIAAGGGLGVFLEACAGPPVTIQLAFDAATLVADTPVEVPFTLARGNSSVAGSTWLVKRADGTITAFDPRCTHALCQYSWAPDVKNFECKCHAGAFDLQGTVLAGAPPRPLGRFPLRLVGDLIEVDVPSDFATPKASL